MKCWMGWSVAAVTMLLACGAQAQTVVPVSDFAGRGPYAAVPPEAAWPGYGPRVLAPGEITAVVRQNGFAPLGNPQQRGIVYTISVIDPVGDDGRLVVDARSGRIIRFLPAARMRADFNRELDLAYGPVGPLPPIAVAPRRAPRPPLPIPHVARKPQPPAPQTAQAAQAPAVPPLPEAKPPAPIQPTQQMPAAQGLD